MKRYDLVVMWSGGCREKDIETEFQESSDGEWVQYTEVENEQLAQQDRYDALYALYDAVAVRSEDD